MRSSRTWWWTERDILPVRRNTGLLPPRSATTRAPTRLHTPARLPFSYDCSLRRPLAPCDPRPRVACRILEGGAVDRNLVLGGPLQVIDHQRVEFDARGLELETHLLLYGGEDRRGG